MATVKRYFIVEYNVPEIGKYQIDEGMTAYLDGKEFSYNTSIDEAKDAIRSSISEQSKTITERLNQSLNTIKGLNAGLIDELYRKDLK